MNKRQLKNAEWSILITTILLIVVGLVAQYSATLSSDLADFKKQIIWLVVSIPIFLITIIIDYRTIAKASIVFYIVCLILLLTVLFTSAVNGARSWFSIGPISIQPGEFAKIAVVLLLATTINKINKREHGKINSPLKLIETIGICLLPVILIALQPDYGTAMSYIVSLLFMLFVAGINKKYIFISILLIIVLVPVMYFFVLPEHAKSRIDVYLNPYLDPRGAGYNIIQSKIAIGAGGLIGLGWLKGTQTHLGFLYPKTTDFIFSVIGEEMGFAVTAGIVIVYVILITKAIYIAKTAKDDLGSYIATGIAGIFLFHMVENIGMTIGLLPITGVPLPFVSYGGSSLLTNLILIALLLNISGRRQKAIFIE